MPLPIFAKIILLLSIVLRLYSAAAAPAQSAKVRPSKPAPSLSAPAALENAPPPSKPLVGLQPLDGVNIEAVETYQNPKKQKIDFGLCVYPLDPYYNGFGIDLGYSHYYNKTFSWQILDVNYIYSVNKGLTSQLAENYNVNPTSIERLTFIVSSNIEYVIAYGKFVLLRDHIRYFRSSLYAGPAYATSNKRGTVGLSVGWRIETFVNDDFSWVLQIKDVYAPSNIDNNLAFVLGTAYGF